MKYLQEVLQTLQGIESTLGKFDGWGFVSTIIATFIGAGAAFLFARKSEKKQNYMNILMINVDVLQKSCLEFSKTQQKLMYMTARTQKSNREGPMEFTQDTYDDMYQTCNELTSNQNSIANICLFFEGKGNVHKELVQLAQRTAEIRDELIGVVSKWGKDRSFEDTEKLIEIHQRNQYEQAKDMGKLYNQARNALIGEMKSNY